MKVTIEDSTGKQEVFTSITDLYIAYRQTNLVATDGTLHEVVHSRSHSWGTNLRELVKEVQQSLVELQDYLKARRDGNPS